jgi:hypothetical protein
MADARTHIDLRDLQGDILRAYGNDYDHTSYAFVRITCPPEQARAWFSGLLDHVTTAQPWKDGKPVTTLNVAVTATGLKALGVSEDIVASFSREFREGMSAQAERLGDVGVSAPDHWERALGTGSAHVLHQRAGGRGPSPRAEAHARRDERRGGHGDRLPAGRRAA